tara:strand:+ start:2588 stop:3550 length:963 start_codon:yes stop_codon:yes gene_type:complete
MSRLHTDTVVNSNWQVRKAVEWVSEHRTDKQCNYANLPSNVVRVGEKDGDNLSTENNLLGQLVHDLAWERSAWTFAVEQHYHSRDQEEGYAIANRVTIMEGLEPIGILDRAKSWEIEIKNQRIKQDLWKKDFRSTTKLKRAKEIINADVYALTTEERLMQSTSRIKDNIRDAARELGHTMQEKFNPIREWVREELMHFSPELIAFSEKMGRAEIVSAYTEAVENNALGRSVKKDMDVGQGKMVIILGDEYHIAHLSGLTNVGGEFHKRYMRFNRDTLDPGLHTALALLKLTEPNTFISGMGFKVSDTEYFLVEEITIEHN